MACHTSGAESRIKLTFSESVSLIVTPKNEVDVVTKHGENVKCSRVITFKNGISFEDKVSIQLLWIFSDLTQQHTRRSASRVILRYGNIHST